MICVPITETNAALFLAALDEALLLADAIELRLDYLSEEDLKEVLAALSARTDLAVHTLIFTLRPREQGGQRDLTLFDRVAFWRALDPNLISLHSFADFEIDLVEHLVVHGSPVPWDNVICSYHDFAGTPPDLDRIFERLKRTPARVVKIATLARHPVDCLRHFEIIDRATGASGSGAGYAGYAGYAGFQPAPTGGTGLKGQAGSLRTQVPIQSARQPSVIALGMGMPGLATRVLAVSRGAMLTFGALRHGAESASGQPSVSELNDLYHIKKLTRDSEIYGVVGYPIGHSLSPKMHNAAMLAAGRDAVYLPFEVESDLGVFIREMVHPRTRKLDWNFRGLSVTIPHKLEVMKYLDEIDPLARKVGAVNTVVVESERLCGYNTDVAGAMKPLDAIFNVRGARVAVLGAGGAARAICFGLAQRGALPKIYGRNMVQYGALAEELRIPCAPLFSFAGWADIVINCTPIGMEGHSPEKSPVPEWSLRGVKLVYDLVYNPKETKLLKEAREVGCQTLGGSAMLAAQAAEQYGLWTGDEPPNYELGV